MNTYIHVNVWQKPLQYCNYPPTNKNKGKKRAVYNSQIHRVRKYVGRCQGPGGRILGGGLGN